MPALPLSRARVNLVKVPDLHPPGLSGVWAKPCALARLPFRVHVLESFSYLYFCTAGGGGLRTGKTCGFVRNRNRSRRSGSQIRRSDSARKSSRCLAAGKSSILSSTTTSASSRNCAAGTPKRSRDFVKPSLFNLIRPFPLAPRVPACWRSEKMPTPCANLIAPSPYCRRAAGPSAVGWSLQGLEQLDRCRPGIPEACAVGFRKNRNFVHWAPPGEALRLVYGQLIGINPDSARVHQALGQEYVIQEKYDPGHRRVPASRAHPIQAA